MIMVDIQVPALNRQYNYMLDEQSTIEVLIPEILEVVNQKEGLTQHGGTGAFRLCLSESGTVMDRKCTLSQYHCVNGARLMLL